MPKAYSQVSLEERCEIAKRLGEGQSLRQIAAALDRPTSTISREVARNSGRKAGYRPAYANQQSKARRWSGSKLIRKPELGVAVLDGLAKASGKVCTRTSGPSGRRVSRVWDVGSTTGR